MDCELVVATETPSKALTGPLIPCQKMMQRENSETEPKSNLIILTIVCYQSGRRTENECTHIYTTVEDSREGINLEAAEAILFL